jgi:biotin carboxyl carrier protein
MSEIKGHVGKVGLDWKTPPRGQRGRAIVEIVGGETMEVSWRRDDDGLWLELPHGVFGFDLQGTPDDNGRLAYEVTQRGSDREWAALAFHRAGEEAALDGAAGAKKGMRVRAQMPGKIIRIMVKPGAQVEKDQPLIVMEAMKMENEIRAQGAGKVGTIKVTEGQAVETGADLMMIE